MEGRTVSTGAPACVPTLHTSGKAFSFGGRRGLNPIALLDAFDSDGSSDRHAFRNSSSNLTHEIGTSFHPCLFQMSLLGLWRPRFTTGTASNLNCFVSIFVFSF